MNKDIQSKGKGEMVDELFKENLNKLENYIFSKVANKEDAGEILEETLISTSQSLPTFKGKSSFFTWLCGIANHEIADFYRKKKIKAFLFSRFPFLEEIVSEALGPEEELLKAEVREEVKKVLSRLSEGYSLILRLKYYNSLSMEEIAGRLNLTVKAVESRLSRAREAFRAEWLAQVKSSKCKVQN